MQPPGRLSGLGGRAFVPADGAGQVRVVAGMKESIWNGEFVKWLPKVAAVVESTQSEDNGGEVRLKSFCSKHVYGAPAWPTWIVCAESAFARPFTPSHPP